MKSKESYGFFLAEHKRLMSVLSLDYWDCRYKLCHLPDAKATTEADADTYVVTVKFAKQREMTLAEVERCARHEICHLLLAEYTNLACKRFVNESELERIEEKLCTLFEKIELRRM